MRFVSSVWASFSSSGRVVVVMISVVSSAWAYTFEFETVLMMSLM